MLFSCIFHYFAKIIYFSSFLICIVWWAWEQVIPFLKSSDREDFKNGITCVQAHQISCENADLLGGEFFLGHPVYISFKQLL